MVLHMNSANVWRLQGGGGTTGPWAGCRGDSRTTPTAILITVTFSGGHAGVAHVYVAVGGDMKDTVLVTLGDREENLERVEVAYADWNGSLFEPKWSRLAGR